MNRHGIPMTDDELDEFMKQQQEQEPVTDIDGGLMHVCSTLLLAMLASILFAKCFAIIKLKIQDKINNHNGQGAGHAEEADDEGNQIEAQNIDAYAGGTENVDLAINI